MAEEPRKPDQKDCCGSGCSPCILDVFEEKLARWKKQEFSENVHIILSDMKYTAFKVISIEEVAPYTYKYTLQALDDKLNPRYDYIPLRMGDYVIVKAPRDQVSRPYTTVLTDVLRTGKIQLIIKLYDDGKMSQILRNVKTDDLLYCRGPYNHFSQSKLLKKRLILIGAGTGILPLYNIAKEIVLDDDSDVIVHMFACFSDSHSILLRDEIQMLLSYWNFHVKYIFSKCNDSEKMRYNETALFEPLSVVLLQNELISCCVSDSVVIICGPPKFNDDCRNAVSALNVQKDCLIVL